MRLLDRYLLRELLTPLFFCLAGFLIFWVGGDWINDQSTVQGMSLRDIFSYYAVKSPGFLVTLIPVALLLALLYALSQHARYHEITAIRAAGVSLWRLSLSYFCVGLVGTIIVFVLNEHFAPDSEARAEEIKQQQRQVNRPEKAQGPIRDFGFTNEREGRQWLIGSYDPNTAEMINPQVLSTLRDGSRRWLKAARATYEGEAWVFHDAAEYRADAGTNSSLVPVIRTNVLAKPQFTESPEEIRSEIKISRRLITRGEADLPIVEVLDYLRLHPQLKRSDARWLYTQLHGRLAKPWTCLVVVLIALPFGAASGRRNVFFGVASSIFLVFAFLTLSRVSLALGVGGHLPPWLAGWLPNIIFGGIGLWLTARVR
jgi:lipopolysaccharide export system permease protein